MNIVGLSMISPITASMLVDRRLFDTIVVDTAIKPRDIEQFAAIEGHGRRKLAIITCADVFRSSKLCDKLAKLDRLIIVESPDVVSGLGARIFNAYQDENGAWHDRRFNYDDLTCELEKPQDLKAIAATAKHNKPQRKTLASYHLFRVIPEIRIRAEKADLKAGVVDVFEIAAASYAMKMDTRAEFNEAIQRFVKAGGDARLTAPLLQYLKQARKVLGPAYCWITARAVDYRAAAKYVDPTGKLLVLPELVYLNNVLLAHFGDDLSSRLPKCSLPRTLRGVVGSDKLAPSLDTVLREIERESKHKLSVYDRIEQALLADESFLAIYDQCGLQRPTGLDHLALRRLLNAVEACRLHFSEDS